MKKSSRYSNDFASALKRTRMALGQPQDAFQLASSRTYVSSLERGIGSPTLNKVDDLAEVLDVHPLTLLAMAYLSPHASDRSAALMLQVASELDRVLEQKA